MKNIISLLEDRGFLDQLTSEDLKDKVSKPIKLYVGFDPTADSLHLGNLLGIIALKWFEMHGHEPIALVGGATGKVGDPSGKDKERPLLTLEELSTNVTSLEKQLEGMIGNVQVRNNDEWFKNFSFLDVLRDVGKHFRMGIMLSKESVKSRINSEEGMSFTEFTYQLLQGYDFYHLSENEGVTLQMGGTDQWGNITAGIELTRKLSRNELFGAVWPLLTRSDGKKFGKSEGGAIWLSKERTSPYRFYQYLVRIPDADVIKMLKMLTFLPLEEISEIEKEMETSPNSAQRKLASEVTRFVHGESGLASALKVTEAAKPGSKAVLDLEVLHEIAEEMPSSELSYVDVVGSSYADICVKSGLLASKGEVSRLVKNGGAYLNNGKVENPSKSIEQADVIGDKYLMLGSGKKKKLLLKLKK
ncbi:MAG: Tyrosine--tRNA ligase [Chlamydiia bacterium]|nr:Tyrosine--tRNA ligase [Chlamydiia bacterium]MCH9615892.1 Tyrosine--tRNA ligase [Chlamydiia bacterium]MCH9628705.1 Tyrosine--tRNA ligase [Chlamydiia bacterium]